MKRTLLASAALAALATAPALAEEVYELDTIEVLANIEAVDAARTGAAVTVLSEDELTANGETALIEEMEGLPGITVSRNGPIGTQATVAIRGVNQNNIAVRYEGIDISDPSSTQVAFDFGGLTTGMLGRVDILRGSQSALLGSQAIGGAILMQGRRAEGIGQSFEAQAEIGSYNTRQTWLSWVQATETSELSLGYGHYQTDGFSAWDENGRANPEDDGYEEDRLNLYYRQLLGEATTLEVAGFFSKSVGEFDDNFSGFFFDSANVNTRYQRGARLSLSHDFDGVEVTGTLSRFDIDRTLDYSGYIIPYEGRRDTAQIKAAFSPTNSLDVVVGAEHKKETFVDAYQSRSTTTDSVFAEGLYAIDMNNDITLSLRHDTHSAFGGQWSARLNGAHRIGNGVTLRWSGGSGYRAPSNYELYGFYIDTSTTPPTNVLVGDPTLGVEKSRSFDIGVEKDFGAGKVAVTAFYLEARDLIDYSFTTDTYVQRSGKARRRGLEFSGEWQVSEALNFSGAYTLTKTSLSAPLDSSGWATTVPRHALRTSLAWQAGEKLSIGGDVILMADKPGVSSYAVANMAATYQINDALEAYLRIDNLFNREYQAISGYGTSDRAAYFGIRASF